MSFCMTYSIISPYKLFLDFPSVFYQGQIWRLITTFFFAGGFSMNFLFAMMMIYYTFSQVESHFKNKESELATMLLFNAVTGIIYGWLASEFMVMQSPYVFSVLYVWSKLVPDLTMQIYGFPVQSGNLPWVLIAFHLFTGGNPFSDLVGVAAGHTYYYLKHVLPESHGYNLLKTPSWIDYVTKKLKVWAEGEQPRRVYGMNNDGANANVDR